MRLRNCVLSFLLSIPLCGYEVLEIPARTWLEQTYLPSLSGKILYVGVGSYTTHYHCLTKSPNQFATLDFDKEKACFGSPYIHYVADFLTFPADLLFDHVSLFGVMGHPPTVTTSKYTILDESSICQALQQADRLTKIGGTLLLGPNHKNFPGQDADFWLNQFSRAPLDKYKIIFSAIFSDNFIWWGEKIQK
jgi:hypothetical protein